MTEIVRSGLGRSAGSARPDGVFLAGNFLSGLGLARAPIEDLRERLEGRGRRVVTASRRRNGFARAADMLQTAFRRRGEYGAAVVDLYSGAAFLWGEALTVLLRRLDRDFVLCLHGGGLPAFAKRHPARVRACLARARFVTAPSGYLVEQMRPYRGDIEELPNALDLGAYRYRERSRPAPRLAWLRTFRGIYNPALAPAVVARLVERGFDARLTMYGKDWGDGSVGATLETARRLGVEQRLTIGGAIPKRDVPRALDEADIFLNTTDVDNAPVSVVEALASGLCVVSTNVGGLPYLVVDGQEALLAPPGDAAALAAAVERVLKEPGLAGALSRRGRMRADRYDWRPTLDRWLTLLEECRAGRAAEGVVFDRP